MKSLTSLLYSASRLVLILFSVTICVALLIGRVDAKDFMLAAMAVYSYYFTKQTPGSTPATTPDTDGRPHDVS